MGKRIVDMTPEEVERQRASARKRRDPSKSLASARAYAARNPEQVRLNDKARYERDKESRKHQAWKNRLLRDYGVTEEDYKRMLTEQEGRCFLCDRLPKRRLSVDHNHRSGKARRLLCDACNSGLGFFGDSPELLRKAADYLEDHE